MGKYLLTNATIVTGSYKEKGAILIDGERISRIWTENENGALIVPDAPEGFQTIDLESKVVMAGGIDAHVHFREPGATHKADMESESKAALLGGITSVIDMPNNNPPTVSEKALDEKFDMANGHMWTNYGFHIGATNANVDEIKKLIAQRPQDIAGVKVFMGSSTGNMLVDDSNSLAALFGIHEKPVLVHSEDEGMIRSNLEKAKQQYGEDIPLSEHPNIRSRKACFMSTMRALEMAMSKGTRLHICHVTTYEEIHMIRAAKLQTKRITAESSANYMTFCDEDFATLGAKVKCNPSVKTADDKQIIRDAFHDGIIDTIGSDHAPHLLSEKDAPYTKCPSGMPSIQQSFSGVITAALAEETPLERVASAMSERSAEIFEIKHRGFLREGYYADIVVIDPEMEFTVGDKDSASSSAGIDYKCGWSPYEGLTLKGGITKVFLSGDIVVDGGKLVCDKPTGQKLSF